MNTKYRNKPTVVDGIWFQSILESKLYLILRDEERAGIIFDLKRQPKVPIEINGIHICYYILDFRYKIVETGEKVYVDAKGKLTDTSSLKMKLVKALYPNITFKFWPERGKRKRERQTKRKSIQDKN